MADAPAFDPAKPFETVEAPPFDPSKPFEAVQAPSGGQMSSVNALGRGMASGASLGFYDELRGLAETGGANADEPMSIGHILKGAYRRVTGSDEADKAYAATVARERGLEKQAQSEHPYLYGAGNVGGALATAPIGVGTVAATLPARIAQGARVGATYGAISGFGEGEGLPDSLTRGVIQGAGGGLLGAAAPPVVEGITQGVRAASAPIRNAISGAINPEREATRRVATAIQRDADIDPAARVRLTPQEFLASAQNNGPARVMDLGGDLTRRLADSAAITSPEGSTLLNRTINDRYEGQTQRINDWLRNTFNYPNARAQQQAIERDARAINNPAYTRAFEEHDGPLWSDELEGLAQDPVVQSAIRRASVSVRTDRTLQGYRPMNNPFTFEQSSGRLTLRRDPNGNPVYPDLRFWDQVKRELDKQGTRESQVFSRTLRDHLDELTTNPQSGDSSYQLARQGAAHFFGAENALEAGQNFLNSKMANGEARDALRAMTAPQRQLFQDGYVSRLIDHLNEVPDRRNAVSLLFNSPAARERMQIALGPQRTRELEAGLRVEGIMDLARSAVQGNSWTARRLYDLGLAGGSGLGAIGTYNMDPREMATGALVAAIASGGRHIDQRVAHNVAQLLVSQDPRAVVRGMGILTRNQAMLDNVRNWFDRKLAGTTGSQATKLTVRPLQQATGTMPALADQNQPQQRAHGGRVNPHNINPNPTEHQKRAGNYAKDHVSIHGMELAIENPKGAARKGIDPSGKAWSVKMPAHYGYIKGSIGADKDHVDVYLGPHSKAPKAFVIDQLHADTGKFDEHKTFLGFASKNAVVHAYRNAFSDGRAHERMGNIHEMSVADFKRWLELGNTKKPFTRAA